MHVSDVADSDDKADVVLQDREFGPCADDEENASLFRIVSVVILGLWVGWRFYR
jgi:hypothetical protein